MSDREIDVVNRIKSIDDYARAMYTQAHIRWEEMNAENADTDVLIKARDIIQKELDRRLRFIDNEWNGVSSTLLNIGNSTNYCNGNRKEVAMNEIEKMMQNANVKKHWNSTPYGGIEEYYPPFTAEKQLKLIKLLAKYVIKIDNTDDEFEFSTVYTASKFSSFEESLANLINIIWQDLTEEEKQQVKEILEWVINTL